MNNLKEIVTQIKSVIKSTILTQSDIPEEYSHDELNSLINKPDIVIKATSIEDISNVMKVAYKNNIPVVTRGSGTGLVGGAVSVEGGIIIDTTLMNHILELDEDNLTITVEPGVLLMQLTEFVESKGYFYPPDPGEKTATIGGNIATNAGGMRAVKYGVTGAYVKELTVVLSNGDILNLGSKTVKNSSGYNLTNLIVGSEGTLCIIAKATLKIIPLPTQVISLLVPFKDMQTALNLVNKIIKFKIVPVAIEYMTKETLLYVEKFLNKKFPDTTHDAYILLTFDGSSAEQMKYEYEQVADLCLDNGAIDVLLVDNDDRKKVV
jgi:glycolate oxidase